MCGICGRVSWNEPPDGEVIQRMMAKLVHRGPDAGGSHVSGPVALGHRRLAIIDPSEAGNQPMVDGAQRFWIVFNGEIYNFQDIRRELSKDGAVFRTRTDTEVILEAFKRWGPDCLERFNGMFALAIWDETERRLFLARDRLGKKPLFYYPLVDGGLVFASELKALREDPAVKRTLNLRALSHYLSLNYTLTAECILDGVQKLPAAHYLIVEKDKPIRRVLYWDLASYYHNKRRYTSVNEAAEELSEILSDAVRLRLISDVPLGAFLSGGIDSSAIVASMCRLRSSRDNHTFSIGFREKSYSELDYARAVARQLDVVHHDRVVEEDMTALLPRIAYFADEPFADTSIIPMYFLAEFARREVTVCLTGDGGDELFAGYETYIADKLYRAVRHLPRSVIKVARDVLRFVCPVSLGKVSLDYKLRQFLLGHGMTPQHAHYSWRTIFSNDEKRDLLRPEFHAAVMGADPFAHFSAYFKDVGGCHWLDQATYVDTKTWLVDDILVKVDRASMAHSLEARAPLLDHRLVEYAASLPPRMKLRGFTKKHVLKVSQAHRLQRRVVHRAKRGFNAPVSHWMRGGLSMLLAERNGESLSRELFRDEEIERLLLEHQRGSRDNSLKLLGIINLDLWAQHIL